MNRNSFSKNNSSLRHLLGLLFFSIFILLIHHSSSAEEMSETLITEAGVLETVNEEVLVPSQDQEIEQTDNLEILSEPVLETVAVETVTTPPSASQETQDTESLVVEDLVVETEVEILEDPIQESYIENLVIAPFLPPQNLPQVRAFPEYEDKEIDQYAVHSCRVRDFSVDLSILPNKNNMIFVDNPKVGPANIEVIGLPRGLELVFTKTHDSEISVTNGQKEIPFTIEKGGDIQKGNFNVIFLFSKRVGNKNSTTTCQMNIKL